MKLTHADRASAAWQRLRAHYAERLSVLRSMNDGDIDEVATARLRGRIAEIKNLLALDDDEDPAQLADGTGSPMSSAHE